MSIEGSNKRIVKNTLFLYVRSFLTMAIGLFTSRIILQALGVDNFGIYGVVGSFVGMFTIVNGVLAVGTSRFLTYELGCNNAVRLKKTFSASFTMHAALALALFILFETIGLWFLNHKLNIPADREFAANVVYQLSILTCMFGLTQVPYSAIIIAHEKMDIYAYIAIAEVVFKLVFVCLLLYVPFQDNLIAYAVILAVWNIALQLFYRIYCHKRFPESHLMKVTDKDIYKGMLTYSLWDFIGQFCASGNGQGLNLLINMFFGVTLNAARAVAFQVQNAVTQFSGNFMTSVNPQIVKTYAAGDYQRFFQLIFESARYSYYLLFLVSLPLFLEAEYILQLWLVEVPPYATSFLRFIMFYSLFRVVVRPVINGVHATGNVKYLNLTSGIFAVSAYLPSIYICFKMGLPYWSAFVVEFMVGVVSVVLEVNSLNRNISFSRKDFYIGVYLKSIALSLLASVLPVVILLNFHPSFGRLIFVTLTSILSTTMCVLYLGISKELRNKILSYLINNFFR